MRVSKVYQDCKVIPTAKERYYSNNSDTSVLLLHGFTGNPGNMNFLGKKIFQETGFSVYIPRLPGHGTNKLDFHHSTAQDWTKKAYDSYLNLKAMYKKVYVGGLSMGGLLSILIASNFKINKLFLIAAALYSHIKVISLSHILKYIIPVIKSDKANASDEFEDGYHKILYENYWKEYYTAQVAELHKLMRLARKKLASVKANTLIICSKKDEQVPMKAAYTIEKKLATEKKKMLVFENSPHVINDGPEKELCADRIIEFLLK